MKIRLPLILMVIIAKGGVSFAVIFHINHYRFELDNRKAWRSQVDDLARMGGIFAAVSEFQETLKYRQLMAEADSWLTFDEHPERSLLHLLTTPGFAPEPGYLLHIPNDMIKEGVFVNPWGNPYRVIIAQPPNDSFPIPILPRGSDGSMIFIISEGRQGDRALFLTEQGTPFRRE
jgi:hypothetical protein